MHSYTVTIGRDIARKPMTEKFWLQFQADIVDLMTTWGGTPELKTGVGRWNDHLEDSASITLLRPRAFHPAVVDSIRALLSVQALHYSQDSIALTIGQSELLA